MVVSSQSLNEYSFYVRESGTRQEPNYFVLCSLILLEVFKGPDSPSGYIYIVRTQNKLSRALFYLFGTKIY